jgi:hypothetical protein
METNEQLPGEGLQRMSKSYPRRCVVLAREGPIIGRI